MYIVLHVCRPKLQATIKYTLLVVLYRRSLDVKFFFLSELDPFSALSLMCGSGRVRGLFVVGGWLCIHVHVHVHVYQLKLCRLESTFTAF